MANRSSGCGSNVLALVVIAGGAVWAINHFSGFKPSDKPSDNSYVSVPVAPVVVKPSQEQLRAIVQASTFASFRSALMSAYPYILDVKWFKPTKGDPASELEIILRSEFTGVTDRRNEMLTLYRQLIPVLLKSANPWKIVNLNNGVVLILDRQLGYGVNFDFLSYDDLQALSNKSNDMN